MIKQKNSFPGPRVAQYIAVTMIGGAVSEAAGGDFLEGAVAAAMVHLFNDSANDWKDYKDPMAVAFGGGNKSMQISQNFINKTNKTPFGKNLVLIKSSINEVDMLNINMFNEKINLDVGKLNYFAGSASLLDKMYGIDLGWNTFGLSVEFPKIFGLKPIVTGYAGGLSGTIIFKPNKVTAGYSFGVGGKVDVGW